MTLTKTQRETVRVMFGGRCAYCGRELPEKGWHADHVKAIYRSWPIIPDPNGLLKGRGEDVIENFNFRFAEAFGLVAETGSPVVFWFERYQQS
jgi:hypothetical protein